MAAFEILLPFLLKLKSSHFNVSQKEFLTDFTSLWLLLKRSKLPVLHCWLRLAAGKLHSPAEETTVQTRSAATLTPRSRPYDSSSLVLSWTPLSHGHIQSRLQVSSLSSDLSSSPDVLIPAVPSNTNVGGVCTFRKRKKLMYLNGKLYHHHNHEGLGLVLPYLDVTLYSSHCSVFLRFKWVKILQSGHLVPSQCHQI